MVHRPSSRGRKSSVDRDPSQPRIMVLRLSARHHTHARRAWVLKPPNPAVSTPSTASPHKNHVHLSMKAAIPHQTSDAKHLGGNCKPHERPTENALGDSSFPAPPPSPPQRGSSSALHPEKNQTAGANERTSPRRKWTAFVFDCNGRDRVFYRDVHFTFRMDLGSIRVP